MIKTGPSRGEAEKDALSLCSHHVLVKGGDTRVLATGYPYIHKAKGEDAKEMEGQEPDIQHQKPQPVSAHHGGGGAQDPLRGQIGKIQQQIVAHGKGEIPKEKSRQADRCQPSYDRKGSNDGICRYHKHVQLNGEQADELSCSDEGADTDAGVRVFKKTCQQIPDQSLFSVQESQKNRGQTDSEQTDEYGCEIPHCQIQGQTQIFIGKSEGVGELSQKK